MMITEQLIELQDRYIECNAKASNMEWLPIIRWMHREEAEKARDRFYETYGEKLCLHQQ